VYYVSDYNHIVSLTNQKHILGRCQHGVMASYLHITVLSTYMLRIAPNTILNYIIKAIKLQFFYFRIFFLLNFNMA
jgi:hypothetical protein